MASQVEHGRSGFTVDDALVAVGFGKFQYFVFAYAGMGWIGEAMEMMLLSFVGPSVQSEWNLSAGRESAITSAVFAGMLIGAYTWGVVSDIYGRRTGFLFTAIVTSAAGLLSAFAPNYWLLIALRFIVGIGLGGGPVLSSWFLEFVPAPNRGFWMIIFSVFWIIGTIFEASIAWLVMPRFGWRLLLALSALPTSLLLMFYCATPESLRYLCTKGKTAEAASILEKMARMNRKELPAGLLVSHHGTELDEISDTCSSSEEIGLVAVGREESSNSDLGAFNAVVKLLSPKLITTTLLLWIVFFGNAFSYYGIVLLTSELNNGSRICSKGASPVESTHSSNDSLYVNVFISSFAEIPGLVVSAVIIDTLGRKVSMASMLLLSCMFMLPLVFNRSATVIAVSLFLARLTISASFNVVYIYAPEIYPTTVRATGMGVASSMGRIGGILCPLVAVALVRSCHQTLALLLFEAVLSVSGVAVLLFPHETRGRKLNDSVAELK